MFYRALVCRGSQTAHRIEGRAYDMMVGGDRWGVNYGDEPELTEWRRTITTAAGGSRQQLQQQGRRMEER